LIYTYNNKAPDQLKSVNNVYDSIVQTCSLQFSDIVALGTTINLFLQAVAFTILYLINLSTMPVMRKMSPLKFLYLMSGAAAIVVAIFFAKLSLLSFSLQAI
jgi:hypothetical protein